MMHDQKKAGAMQEITMEALKSAAVDLRAMSRIHLDKKLDQFIGSRMSVSETRFEEQETTRTAGIYADDADFDDPDLEPIGYEEVPILVIRATRLFIDAPADTH